MDTQCPAVIESFHPKSLLIFSESGCKSFNEAAQSPGTHTVDVRGIAPNNDITPTSNSPRSVAKRISFILYNEQFKNPRYLCSIESAARQNPHHEVVLYAKNITNFIESTGEWYRNTVSRNSHFRKQFQILELDWDSSFHGTPLESWWRRKVYKKSKWVNQNLGNAFRLSTLWKHGGVYLDMDIVSLNPVGHVGKVIGCQIKPDILNNAFFSFEARDPFVWLMVEEFGSKWSRMVERTYTKNCKKDSSVFAGIWRENPIPTACDFKLYLPMFFIRFLSTKRKYLLKNSIGTAMLGRICQKVCVFHRLWLVHPTIFLLKSIGLHWWNKGIKGTTVEVDTVLEGVMKAHCPALFDTWHPDVLGSCTKEHC
ncbi:nucleotide-diphospho-sugar transferase [Chytriomyces sp. MP71]|nr:nucleotide-diphospho-sugar transferase [Chytriomyces sp. MP71]